MNAPTKFDVLLARPKCQADLVRVAACENCSAEFSVQDGVRSYFPQDAVREITYRFTSARSTPDSGFGAALSYPPPCHAAHGFPRRGAAFAASVQQQHPRQAQGCPGFDR
jgi:hypothetical protein